MSGTVVVMPMQRDASFGDLLVQAPFLHGLKGEFGAERVVVVSPHPFVRLVSDLGLADAVHILPDGDRSAIRALLRAESPRWAINLRASSVRSSWLLRSSRDAQTIGWRSLANRLFLDLTVPRVRDDYYALVFGRVLSRLGGAIDPMACMAAIARTDPNDSLQPGERRLLCLPAGKLPQKQWGAENYHRLGDLMAQRWPGLRRTVALGPRESAMAAAFPGWEVLLAPAPARLAAVCCAAAGIVANDCGPGHIAQMSGRPMVTLFHHAPGDREALANRMRLWWWRRPHARALTTATPRPLAELPVPAVAAALESAMADGQVPAAPVWWQA